MKTNTSVILQDQMHFTGELENVFIPLDADEQFGGQNKGARPKGLVLTALAGCTAMDVISILRKMRTAPLSLKVEVDSETTDTHPKVYKNILVTYYVKGEKITEEKVERAVKLSLDEYCGVAAMLKSTSKIDYKIIIE